MQLFHLTFSTQGRGPMLASEPLRLAALRVLARHGRGRVVLFCIVDDHLHIVVLLPAEQLGHLRRALLLGLRALSDQAIEPAHVRPVRDRAHMQWLVRYLLTQPEHHGLRASAIDWSGSCLWDLVGARYIQGLNLQLDEALPRWGLDDTLAVVGLESADVEPSTLSQVRTGGVERLQLACRRAAGCARLDAGNHPARVARATIGRLARAAEISTRDLAFGLDIPQRTARGLARMRAPDSVCWAALRQHRLLGRLSPSVGTLATTGVRPDKRVQHAAARG